MFKKPLMSFELFYRSLLIFFCINLICFCKFITSDLSYNIAYIFFSIIVFLAVFLSFYDRVYRHKADYKGEREYTQYWMKNGAMLSFLKNTNILHNEKDVSVCGNFSGVNNISWYILGKKQNNLECLPLEQRKFEVKNIINSLNVQNKLSNFN